MSRDGSTKVTKYSFQKALLAAKSLTRIAADLGISVRTAQRYLTRFGINLSRQNDNKGVCNSMIIAPKPAPRRLTHLEQVANDHKPFTEDDLRELEALGWTPHDCPGEACPLCRKVSETAKGAEAAAPAQAAIPPAPKPAPEPAAPRDACSICGKVFEPGKRKVHGANCTEWPRFRGGGVAV